MMLRRFLFAALVVFGLVSSAQAIVFDWDAAYGTWGGGGNDPSGGNSATRNFDNDAGHTGNDVSITIANLNGGGFDWTGNGMSVGQSPNTGGVTPPQNALQYEVADTNNTGIRTTITFNYTQGVANVSFTLWDVDKTAGQWIDVISSITAQTVTGTTIGPTSVVGGPANSVTGSGTTFVVTGTGNSDPDADDGNVTITFGNTPITSVTFLWRNTDPALGQQFIALHDINYVPVPEVGTSLAALGVCGGVGLTARWRRRTRKV
jgi:hypothetical protein